MNLFKRIISLINNNPSIATNITTPVKKDPSPPAPAPAPAPNLQPDATLQQRLNYLDQIWLKHGNPLIHQAVGTKLWHSGVIGPRNPPNPNLPVWTTNDPAQRTNYNGWARQNGLQTQRTAYLIEFETTRKLSLADFHCESLRLLTSTLCNSDHNIMKEAVGEWLKLRKLDGIVRVNSAPDEVVIGFPAVDIKPVNYTII